MTEAEMKEHLIELRQLIHDINDGNTMVRFVDWQEAVNILTDVIDELRARVTVAKEAS